MSGYISYLPDDTPPSCTHQIADGVHAMIVMGDRDTATMVLVDSPCDLDHLAEHRLAITQHPDIRLDMLLENGSEPAHLISNMWILSWDNSYNLRIGEECVLQLISQRQQMLVLPNANA
ncbi:hypothetical protein ABPG77_003631 [Micractinium sp. CCAP 211/92]